MENNCATKQQHQFANKAEESVGTNIYQQNAQSTTQSQCYKKKVSQSENVISSSMMETKVGLRSPVSSPQSARKHRNIITASSPNSIPQLARKNVPLAYKVSPAYNVTAHSPASTISLSSISSPSLSPPPPPIPMRTPRNNSTNHINQLHNMSGSPKEPSTQVLLKSHQQHSALNYKITQNYKKQNRSLSSVVTNLESARGDKPLQVNSSSKQRITDLDKMMVHQKMLDENAPAAAQDTKIDADFYDAEIEMMNKYLKSLPDYSELDKKLHRKFQECEELYDRIKRRQSPLVNCSSKQTVAVPKREELSNCWNSQQKQHEEFNQSKLSNGFKQRLFHPSILDLSSTSPILQRSVSSSHMPCSTQNQQQSQDSTLSANQNTPIKLSTPYNSQTKKVNSRVPSLSLNKQLINDFWSENLASCQKYQAPKLSIWNHDQICASSAGCSENSFKVDVQTAKKLAIFDPTVAEAAQKELHKTNKLQKNASLSHLDMEMRKEITKKNFYKVVCNEGSPSKIGLPGINKTQTFSSRVPVKIYSGPELMQRSTLNKSVSLSHVPNPFSREKSTSPTKPFSVTNNRAHLLHKSHIPSYMKQLSSLSRSNSNSAILILSQNTDALSPATKVDQESAPTSNSYCCASTPGKIATTSTANAYHGLYKSSSFSVFSSAPHNPLIVKHLPPSLVEMSLKTNETFSTVVQPTSHSEFLVRQMHKTNSKKPQQRYTAACSTTFKSSTDKNKNSIIRDSPSIQRKLEKSNSTISSSSVATTNCCSSHLSKCTTSLHVQAITADLEAEEAQKLHQKTKPNASFSSNVRKKQHSSNLDISKCQKCENDHNEYLKLSTKRAIPQSLSKTTPNIVEQQMGTITTLKNMVPQQSVSKSELIKHYQSPEIGGETNKINDEISSTSQIPVPSQVHHQKQQQVIKKCFPIGKSNSTSQIQLEYQRQGKFQHFLQHQQQELPQYQYTAHHPQHKRPFLNWSSFACSTMNDSTAVRMQTQQQINKLQHTTSAANVPNKYIKPQHPKEFKPVAKLRSFTQRNTNKENKIGINSHERHQEQLHFVSSCRQQTSPQTQPEPHFKQKQHTLYEQQNLSACLPVRAELPHPSSVVTTHHPFDIYNYSCIQHYPAMGTASAAQHTSTCKQGQALETLHTKSGNNSNYNLHFMCQQQSNAAVYTNHQQSFAAPSSYPASSANTTTIYFDSTNHASVQKCNPNLSQMPKSTHAAQNIEV